MTFTHPVTELIPQRFSCRTYIPVPLTPEQVQSMQTWIANWSSGPLGTPLRFILAAAGADDPRALRSLGTYGSIKNPAGFIIGAIRPGKHALEDYGYALECILLQATDAGLGTCWLGGNFTKSSFSKKINALGDESVPAVASIGRPAEGIRERDIMRKMAKADQRLAWEALFFQTEFGRPLDPAACGSYAAALQMLRLAPSARNYQPWRVVKAGNGYHFYIQRTPGFGPRSLTFKLMALADMQRIDIGIAMAHFELTARECGLTGHWEIQPAPPLKAAPEAEYVVTWVAE